MVAVAVIDTGDVTGCVEVIGAEVDIASTV
jgi:hypothetical protein